MTQEHKTQVSLTKFAAGDEVPEWLLAVEPMHPDAITDTPKFLLPCDVVETEDYFIIQPRVIGSFSGMLSFNGNLCTICAPGKRVESPIAKSVIEGLDYKTAAVKSFVVRTVSDYLADNTALRADNTRLQDQDWARQRQLSETIRERDKALREQVSPLGRLILVFLGGLSGLLSGVAICTLLNAVAHRF